MAIKLSDKSTYLKSFVDGQGGGANNYDEYPEDLDQNFTDIEDTVDDLVDEVQLTQGQNSLILLDLAQSTTPAITTGTFGEHSYDASLIVTDTEIRIQPGSAYASDSRLFKTTTDDLPGSGGVGTRWVALQTNGTVTLETAAAQGVLDLWSANWDGSDFDSLTRLANILPDGDYFQALMGNFDLNQYATTTFTVDSDANIDLPNQPRCRAVDATFTVASSDTLDDLEFADADDFDVGAMHNPASNPEQVVVPTGADGIYMITAQTTFDEDTAAGGGSGWAGDRRLMQILVDGTIVAKHEQAPHPTPSDQDTFLNLAAIVNASAADVIKVQVLQDAGGTMAVVNSSLAVAKIA